MRRALYVFIACGLLVGCRHTRPAQAPRSPQEARILGRWDLMQQLGNRSYPGWLELTRSGRSLVGYYVGGEGSVRPVGKVTYDPKRDQFTFTVPPQFERFQRDLVFTFKLAGDQLQGQVKSGKDVVTWTAQRAPELIREKEPSWGTPRKLIDENLSMWKTGQNNKFRVVDGVLQNTAAGSNLISRDSFEDFKLHLEFRYPKGGNSGVYLRGRYEVQIADTEADPLDPHSLGGVYGFLGPSVNASKGPDQWQSFDITLVGRRVTIVLNGQTVVNDRIIPGLTGAALDSNEGTPGPLYLQGDHGPVEFRNIVITPAR